MRHENTNYLGTTFRQALHNHSSARWPSIDIARESVDDNLTNDVNCSWPFTEEPSSFVFFSFFHFFRNPHQKCH